MANPKRNPANTAARTEIAVAKKNGTDISKTLIEELFAFANQANQKFTEYATKLQLLEGAIQDAETQLLHLGEIKDTDLVLQSLLEIIASKKNELSVETQKLEAALKDKKEIYDLEFNTYQRERKAELAAREEAIQKQVADFQATKKDYEERTVLAANLEKAKNDLQQQYAIVSTQKKDNEHNAALAAKDASTAATIAASTIANLEKTVLDLQTALKAEQDKNSRLVQEISSISTKGYEAIANKSQLDQQQNTIRDLATASKNGKN